MVWQQGEGDARDIAGIKNALSYGANLNNLIKRIRADLEAPGLAFIYAAFFPCPLRPVFRAGKKCGRGKRMWRKNPVPPSPSTMRFMSPQTISSCAAWTSAPLIPRIPSIWARMEFWPWENALPPHWKSSGDKKLTPRIFFLPHFLQPRQPHPENQ